MRLLRVSVSLIRQGELKVKRNEKVSKLIRLDLKKYDTFDEMQDEIVNHLKNLKASLLQKMYSDIPSFVEEKDVENGKIYIRYKYNTHHIETVIDAKDFLRKDIDFTTNTVKMFYVDDLLNFIVAVDRHELDKYIVEQKISTFRFTKEEVDYVLSKCKDTCLADSIKDLFPKYYLSHEMKKFASAVSKMKA